MISFREIDKSNYLECICLKVKDEQRGFVADNARSLVEARFEEGLYAPSIPATPWWALSSLTMIRRSLAGA